MRLAYVNKPVTHEITAESSGLSISYTIYSPLGVFQQGTAQDLGDGRYSVTFTPNQDGRWILEYKFPDGYIIKVEFMVLPEPRLLRVGDNVCLVYHSEVGPSEVDLYDPSGNKTQLTPTQIADGNYQVCFDLNDEGSYFVVWKFPDGFWDIQGVIAYSTTEEIDLLEKIYTLLQKHDKEMRSLIFSLSTFG